MPDRLSRFAPAACAAGLLLLLSAAGCESRPAPDPQAVADDDSTLMLPEAPTGLTGTLRILSLIHI